MYTPCQSASPERAAFGDAHSHVPAADPDDGLVQRARSGESGAKTALWERHYATLYAFFDKSLSNREEAEDLTSETLLAAFERLEQFRGYALPESGESADKTPCTFRTYLHAIARNQLKQWLRQKRARPVRPFSELSSSEEDSAAWENLPAPTEADPLATLLREADREEVWLALADVGCRSYEQFKALVFFYGCNASQKEAADALYVAETRTETFNTRLQEGRRALLRSYERLRPSDSLMAC
jgi:RNA polymerase sigma factor (sigma-70 family)